ncbi:MAG: sulfite exporter TauE/SafE family protein [Ferrovibrio sp.]|uniref:sulfite exporter TauE/SafE family protein n=1 Tax=Ferrovibrio sp. TaxID=1917215 RepID=UPI00262C0B3B|nr:sulfite exporter TauE/SafE family protein [Ferrovibrio sp.]MCW0233784.1 sulfite exporter TauE/SafE family protein [Ferrovibrio sp.]
MIVDDHLLLLWIGAVFLLAGTVKGTIGLGLPSISLGLLAATMDLRVAMILLLAPNVVTNLWQACTGGHLALLLRRLWPFLLCAAGAIWLGTAALNTVDTKTLAALLGLLLALYAVIGLTRPPLSLPARHEIWAGPLLGLANGVLTGLTGSFVVPGVPYLQALGLSRDQLVQAMGLLFMASTLALGASLGGRSLLTGELLWLSLAAVLPALAGMGLGRRLRHRLSETGFKRAFYGALLLLGGYIVARWIVS